MIERRSSERIAIVGGGMLGLTLAHRLSQAGKNITIFEAAPSLGGLAGAWKIGDVTWDKHYHVTLLSDRHALDLLSELGLEKEVRWGQTKTGFYTDGRLHSMSNSWEFLNFAPLSMVDKARLASTILYASRITNWRELENIPVAEWLEKLSGPAVFQKIWLPLLRAKLGENYKDTSAAFIWTTINRLYAARRSGLKQEMFGYVSGGYARVLDTFARQLFSRRVRLETGVAVRELSRQPGGHITVEFGNEKRHTFDRVIVTAATPIASRLAPGLSAAEHERLNRIRYQGIVCASVLMKQQLNDFYVTNITDAGAPFTGVIEMSALVDKAEFGGRHLVYLPKYVASDDPFLAVPDEAVEARFLGAVERMYPSFNRANVEAFRISRVRQVVALPTMNYSKLVPPQITSIPGLYLINTSQIVNGTLNVNETVQLGNKSAHIILSEPYERPLARKVA